MEPALPQTDLFRFKGFALNAHTRELYRRGHRVRLHGQPIDVLNILVAHPGEMITRETLKKSLWPQDTFVDFEHSLNSAINRLREALGDNPDAPRFIETIPRLGYRFVAPLEMPDLNPAPTDSTQARNLVLRPVTAGGESAVGVEEPANVVRRAVADLMKNRGLTAGCAAASFLALTAGIWLIHRPLPPLRIAGVVQVTFGGLEKDVAGTDGSRLFLNLWDQRTVAQIPISGGPVVPIPINLPGFGDGENGPPGHGPWLEDVSPDGSRLLVLDHGDARMPEVWVVAASGDSAHYLREAKEAAWSPDGRSVVYPTTQGEIYLMPADGGEPTLLAELKPEQSTYTPIQGVRFSPDGKLIRFSRGRELWQMNADGRNLHRMLESWQPPAWKCCGRWTADGEVYIFLSGPSPLKERLLLPGAQLWAIDDRVGRLRRPSSEPVKLTSDAVYWGIPVAARQGHTIFSRGVTERSQLVRYDSASREFQPLLGGISAEFVDFSRDGSSVAYVSYPDGTMWKAHRDGTGRVQLTFPPFYPKLIRWSPDGTQILFTDFSPSGLETAYVVSSQGGTPVRVLPEDSGPQGDADWSPDGGKIVFSSRSDRAIGKARQQELRILDLASHKLNAIPDSDNMYAPRWSPNGRFIAAVSMDGAELMFYDLETQQWTTPGAGNYPQSPVWSRDSRFVYFVQYQNHGVFRVSPGDRRVEQVAGLKDFRHAGWNNFWLGLDPGDAPLLLRELGNDEIYQLSIE